jgi:hypothetical protein
MASLITFAAMKVKQGGRLLFQATPPTRSGCIQHLQHFAKTAEVNFVMDCVGGIACQSRGARAEVVTLTTTIHSCRLPFMVNWKINAR